MRQLLILSLLFLSSCGFHLRGSVELPPALSEMTILDALPATDIVHGLRDALKVHGVRVSEIAPVTLRLLSESFSKRVLSVDSSGRAQEYGLSYSVSFSMYGLEGEVWLPEETISLNRDLRFDASAVLATSGEEVLLQEEMRRDAVLQILRRLQYAKQPIQQLPASKDNVNRDSAK